MSGIQDTPARKRTDQKNQTSQLNAEKPTKPSPLPKADSQAMLGALRRTLW